MIVLDELVAATHADVLSRGPRTTCDGFAHDSRLLTPGDCFVAVRGVHGDGHDYLLDAIERGAGAILGERHGGALEALPPGLRERAQQSGVTLLAVADTREALRHYAAHILATW